MGNCIPFQSTNVNQKEFTAIFGEPLRGNTYCGDGIATYIVYSIFMTLLVNIYIYIFLF